MNYTKRDSYIIKSCIMSPCLDITCLMGLITYYFMGRNACVHSKTTPKIFETGCVKIDIAYGWNTIPMEVILSYVMSIAQCQPRKDPSVQPCITALDN